VATDDNSLATAQASIMGTIDEDADLPPTAMPVQGTKTLLPVDADADDLSSMKDSSIYNFSSSIFPILLQGSTQFCLCCSLEGYVNGAP